MCHVSFIQARIHACNSILKGMTKPRQTNYLALISGFVLAATIYSLLDLHRASTDRKEGEDAHQRFATEFKVVSKSLGQAVKRAWRQHSTTNVDLPSPSSSKRLPEDIYDEPPPAEKLGQCIIYRNTNLREQSIQHTRSVAHVSGSWFFAWGPWMGVDGGHGGPCMSPLYVRVTEVRPRCHRRG